MRYYSCPFHCDINLCIDLISSNWKGTEHVDSNIRTTPEISVTYIGEEVRQTDITVFAGLVAMLLRHLVDGHFQTCQLQLTSTSEKHERLN